MYSFLITVILGLRVSCSGSHSMECTMIGEQKICLVREVWGFNGESLAVTTHDNVCHKPSSEEDYISGGTGNSEVYAKIAEGKIYFYVMLLKAPKKPFPIEIIDKPFHPVTGFNKDIIKDGYQKFDLTKNMSWCFKDIF